MMRKGKSLVCIVTVVLVSLVTPGSILAEHHHGSIEGAWVISITGGAGTPPLPSWYKALATFAPDGGLIETITDPLIGTGHGRWTRIHGGGFAVTTLLFRFDEAGNFLGTLKARANMTVDRSGETLSSDAYLFEFFDPNGTLVTSGNAAAHGTRIVVQELP
jgi:hypothetical protein